MDKYLHINAQHLIEIADGNNELIQDLIDLYIKQVPIFTLELEELNKSNDYLALSKLAHKIKGSTSTMGISEIAICMKELETMCKDGENKDYYAELINYHNRISEEAVKELEDLRTRI
jgi:HPt (histidine-containing phosphotransfer) domain-containing protein